MTTDPGDAAFQLEEATIAELHAAIRSGKTTLVKVVQRYIDRARAYNGVSSLLLTEDGAAAPEVAGAVDWNVQHSRRALGDLQRRF